MTKIKDKSTSDAVSMQPSTGGYVAKTDVKYSTHLIFLGLLLVLVIFSTIINQLPQGFIIANGDHAFFPQIDRNYYRFFYLWGNTINGDGTQVGGDPSMIVQQGMYYILEHLGVSDTNKQNIRYFIFLFFSGLSAYLALGLFFRWRIRPIVQFIGALFYVFNGLTILFVSYTGAYLTVHDLHIMLPIVWALFTRGLTDKKYDYLALSAIIVLVFVGSFQNPAFLLLFLLFMIGTAAFCWVTGQIGIRQVVAASITLFAYLAICAFYTAHLFYYLLNPPESLKTNSAVAATALKTWIEANARPVIGNLRFVFCPVNNFPDLFPYKNLPKVIWTYLSFYPFLLLIMSLALIKDKKDRAWALGFSAAFVMIVIMTAKQLLLKQLGIFIFMLPIINVLRSWDKLMALLPFIYMMMIVLGLRGLERHKPRIRQVSYVIMIALLLIYPLPFFAGRFHTTFNYGFMWGYKYDPLVKLPGYYQEIAEYVNKDHEPYKIVTMPYTGEVGAGWVLYPKWKYFGVDFTTIMFDNPVLSPVDVPNQFRPAKRFHEDPSLGRKIFLDLTRLKGIRYMVVNNDVGDEFMNPFEKMLSGINEEFIFQRSFGKLDLYRIKPGLELPVIFAEQQ